MFLFGYLVSNSAENMKIKCSICDKGFAQKRNLYVHLRNVHEIEPLECKLEPTFECVNCDKKFIYQSSLTRHIKKFHSSNNEHNYCREPSSKGIRLICPQDDCSGRFLKYVQLRQHLIEQHDVNIEVEDWTFYSIEDFERWKDEIQNDTQSLYTLDTGIRPLLNGTCKKTYNCHRSYTYKSKGRNIRASKSTLTNKIGKACPSRIEVTFQNDELSTISVKFWKTHCGHSDRIGIMTCKTVNGRIECEACKMIFFMRHHFENHVCNVKLKRPKKISCSICKKTFTSRFNLKRHSYLHTVEKSYECHICRKRFIHKKYVAKHLLTHANEKQFKCKMCDKSYAQSDHLKEHLKTHEGEKPFKCDYCGKKFTRKHSVFVHIKCVHKQDSYNLEKCHLCNKQFWYKSQLVQHIQTHKGECDRRMKLSKTTNTTQIIKGPSTSFAYLSIGETVESENKVKKDDMFSPVNEAILMFEKKSVELGDIIIPKEELKDEYFEIDDNSMEAFAYFTTEVDEDNKDFYIKEESIEF